MPTPARSTHSFGRIAYFMGAVAIAILAWVLYLSLVMVWPPDIWSAKPNVLVDVTTTDGHRLVVEQYWNRVDFYTTDLTHYPPGGATINYVLDADDHKLWRYRHKVDEKAGQFWFQMHGNQEILYDWHRQELTKP